MKNNRIKKLAEANRIVLGSGSPRRMRLLAEVGLKFEQIVPEIEEVLLPDEKPTDFAVRMARSKAEEVSARTQPRDLVIGCDTIVILENQVLGKPSDQEEAVLTLGRLAGKLHTVCTALAIAQNTVVVVSGRELTEVKFNPVTQDQIRDYVASGEPLDKAGAYGIQGMGAFLVDTIKGNLDNVIGFPRTLLDNLAGEILTSIERQNKEA
ncbi:MAG: Maf family protein [bacterium]|nr:Maf family protein [bacterium]